MNDRSRITLVTFLALVIMVAGVLFLNFYNVSITNYIVANNNVADSMNTLDNELYSLSGIEYDDGITEFKIITDEPRTLALNHLKYNHEIYLDHTLVSQNIDKSKMNYDSRYAYKVFEIKKDTTITLKGRRNYVTSYFVSDSQTMDKKLQTRTFFFSCYAIIYIIVFCGSLILYIKNTREYHFFVLAIHALIVLIKIIIKGDLYFLLDILNITLNVQYTLHVITGIVWTILPAIVIYSYYKIPFTKLMRIIFGCLFVMMFVLGVLMDYSVNAVYIMVISLPMYIYVNYYGIKNKKPFYLLITIASAIQGSHSFFMSLVGAKIFNYGEFNFVVYPVANGLTLFITLFMLIFLYGHMKRVAILDQKELEFKKINILRGIGHDLKLPLSVIKSSNEIISHYEMDDERRNVYFERSADAIEELELMVDNIGAYLDKNNYNETISIFESFERFSKQFKYKNNLNHVSIEFLQNDDDAQIMIDYFSFYRMVFNLIDNSVKYSKKNSKIVIYYEITDKVYVYVKDNGIGMTKEEIKSATKPFFRADAARTKEGMGIGLSVVKSICEKSGATLKIYSKKQEYTTVILEFNKL